LEAKGAKRQRVLWASTSSKDPSFSDVKYVEALIGVETINTIPIERWKLLMITERPKVHLEDDLDRATQLLAKLKEKGIDIDTITQKLEDEGIQKFNKAYNKLLEAIEKQKQMAY
jgi:transaldolase/transaldolase/glucose-6-phosphate isomerase